jgi:hypothetical protein
LEYLTSRHNNEKYGLPKTFIPLTELESRALEFGKQGALFEGLIPKGKDLIKQSLESSNEAEWLIIGGTDLLKITK